MSAREWLADIIGADQLAEIELEATVEISLAATGRTVWRSDCAACLAQGRSSKGPEHECTTAGHPAHCTADGCF